MTFEDAVSRCHVRSAIFRQSAPRVRYWKNSFGKLVDQVPAADQTAIDWQEFDPRDHEPAYEALA